MKNKIYIIIMLLIFIGVNTNNAMAFENNDKEEVNIVEESSETKKYQSIPVHKNESYKTFCGT